ncbi:hypothetical protein PILCRDRAFT_906 [Piloderma croceum F 1598]|uniref:Uncharacterized protein n=1 Tax=Piloderma croceum (strain F 1598) TaxID=765440 RepID=A0A0C3G6B9_PILCF|nr:hypothetical protein PILCRDRAFT_906 [Piloderma croceum F 1598]
MAPKSSQKPAPKGNGNIMTFFGGGGGSSQAQAGPSQSHTSQSTASKPSTQSLGTKNVAAILVFDDSNDDMTKQKKIVKDLPSTPERDWTAERECSRLRRLDMTGTDERRNSRSRSGTPTRGGTPVPQPLFQPAANINVGHGHLPAPILDPPTYGDPFRVNAPAEARYVVNLNDDDMPQMWMPFEWQLPPAVPNPDPPPIPQPDPQPDPPPDPPPVLPPDPPPVLQPNPLAQPPAQRVAGARQNRRNLAHQEHPRFPDKMWCTKGKHWVLKTVFGNLLTCNACWATERARAAQL